MQDQIVVHAKLWFNRNQGNTYHLVDIYVDQEFLCSSGMHYGYGTSYEQTARKELAIRGYTDFRNILYLVANVERRKDLCVG